MRTVAPTKWAEEGRVLGELIDRKFDSRKAFADLMGVSDDKVSNWCRGLTRLRGKEREKALRLLHVGKEDLEPKAAGDSQAPPAMTKERRATYNLGKEVKIARAGHRFIPIYGSLAAGNPATSYSQAIEVLEEAEWSGSFDRWGRVVEGDSMNDEFLTGDIVIFENRAWVDGNGVHARKDGEDTFKVYRKTTGQEFELMPTNPNYQPIPGKDWEVLGVCIERRRDVGGNVTDIRRYKTGFMHRFKLP